MVCKYVLRLLTTGPGPAIGTGYRWKETTSADEVIHLIRTGWEWAGGGCDGPLYCDDCNHIFEALAEE